MYIPLVEEFDAASEDSDLTKVLFRGIDDVRPRQGVAALICANFDIAFKVCHCVLVLLFF